MARKKKKATTLGEMCNARLTWQIKPTTRVHGKRGYDRNNLKQEDNRNGHI